MVLPARRRSARLQAAAASYACDRDVAATSSEKTEKQPAKNRAVQRKRGVVKRSESVSRNASCGTANLEKAETDSPPKRSRKYVQATKGSNDKDISNKSVADHSDTSVKYKPLCGTPELVQEPEPTEIATKAVAGTEDWINFGNSSGSDSNFTIGVGPPLDCQNEPVSSLGAKGEEPISPSSHGTHFVSSRPRRSVAVKPKTCQYNFSDSGSSESDLSSVEESSSDEEMRRINENVKKDGRRKSERNVTSNAPAPARGKKSVIELDRKQRTAKGQAPRSPRTVTTRYREGADVQFNGERISATPSACSSRPTTPGPGPSSSSISPSVCFSNGSTKVVGQKTVVGGEKKENLQDRRWREFLNVAAALARGRTEEVTIEQAAGLMAELKAGCRNGISAHQQEANEVKPKGDDGSSSSEDEWEEMETVENESAASSKVEVTIGKKKADVDCAVKWLRQEMNKNIREVYENAHKVHLLCWISHLQLLVKRSLDESLVPSLALTQMPSGFAEAAGSPLARSVATKFAKWIFSAFKFSANPVVARQEDWDCRYEDTAQYAQCVQEKAFNTDMQRAVIFFLCFCALEVPARIVANCRVVSKRKESSLQADRDKEKKKNTKAKEEKGVAEGANTVTQRRDYWIEWWSSVEKQWICVDPLNGEMGSASDIEQKLSRPLLYIFACDNKMGIRDVGARYLSTFATPDYRRQRIDQPWLNKVLRCRRVVADPARARLEDLSFQNDLAARPLPSSVADYKNHPLYVLEKDLLKFEAIYPPPSEQKPIGEVRGNKVYPRSTVYTLQGELNWVKVARSVKEGEAPYKIVKARPNMRIPAELRGDPKDLHVFGFWQTEPYRVPVVENGRIPRNEYGNVYVYQDSMVPEGCIHLKMPGVINLCRRLDKEHVPAVVGWDFHGGSNHPVLEGAVVLEGDVEELIVEWEAAEERRRQREEKKRLDRILGNWKKLIRGSLRLHTMKQRFGKEKEEKEKLDHPSGRLPEEAVETEVREEREAAWPAAQYSLTQEE